MAATEETETAERTTDLRQYNSVTNWGLPPIPNPPPRLGH